jgi:hypothetical protein
LPNALLAVLPAFISALPALLVTLERPSDALLVASAVFAFAALATSEAELALRRAKR